MDQGCFWNQRLPGEYLELSPAGNHLLKVPTAMTTRVGSGFSVQRSIEYDHETQCHQCCGGCAEEIDRIVAEPTAALD